MPRIDSNFLRTTELQVEAHPIITVYIVPGGIQREKKKKREREISKGGERDSVVTWKEHMSESSTLIMAPALSNSPQ